MANFIVNWLTWLVTRVAWLLADLFGWSFATAFLPPTLLKGKVAIVTGANAGIGLEATKALLRQGATVVMACRSLERARIAKAQVLEDFANHGPVPDPAGRLIPLHLDLEDLPSIPRFVEEFHGLELPLHILNNNAGIHLKPFKRVSCGFERTMTSNYFGSFWLTMLLLDDLKASAPSRIVNMASIVELAVWYTTRLPWGDLRGRQLTDSGDRPYTLAKLFMLMATRELARRLEGTGVDVFAVHPGFSNTSWYFKSDPNAYTISRIIYAVRSRLGPWVRVGQPPQTGAISTVFACVTPQLTGTTSSRQNRGVFDALERAVLGGRLRYFGPSYILQNWNNAGTSWAVNPWVYNKGACECLYTASCQLVKEVEEEIRGQERGRAAATAPAGAAPAGEEGVAAAAKATPVAEAGRPLSKAAAEAREGPVSRPWTQGV